MSSGGFSEKTPNDEVRMTNETAINFIGHSGFVMRASLHRSFGFRHARFPPRRIKKPDRKANPGRVLSIQSGSDYLRGLLRSIVLSRQPRLCALFLTDVAIMLVNIL